MKSRTNRVLGLNELQGIDKVWAALQGSIYSTTFQEQIHISKFFMNFILIYISIFIVKH